MRRRPVGGGKVASLEAKIAALESRIQELTSEKGKEKEDGVATSSATAAAATEAFFSNEAAQLLANAAASNYQQNAAQSPSQVPSYSTAEGHYLPDLSAFSPQPRPPVSSVPHLPERYEHVQAPPPQGSGDIRSYKYFAQSHVAHRPPVPLLTPFTLPEPSPLLSLFYP